MEEHVRYANFTNGSLILISERDEDGEDGRIQKTNLDFVSTDLEITDSLHLKTYVNPRGGIPTKILLPKVREMSINIIMNLILNHSCEIRYINWRETNVSRA